MHFVTDHHHTISHSYISQFRNQTFLIGCCKQRWMMTSKSDILTVWSPVSIVWKLISKHFSGISPSKSGEPHSSRLGPGHWPVAPCCQVSMMLMLSVVSSEDQELCDNLPTGNYLLPDKLQPKNVHLHQYCAQNKTKILDLIIMKIVPTCAQISTDKSIKLPLCIVHW